MPATDALQVRTALTEQMDNPRFRGLLDYFAELDGRDGGPVGPLRRRQQFGAAAVGMALAVSETYYVSPDMQALAMVAAEDFPLDETIRRDDASSEAGLMYLPARFRILELRGRLMVVHAVLWDHTRLWLLTDRTDPDDEISQQLRDDERSVNDVSLLGRWDVAALVEFGWDKPIPTTFHFDKGVLPTDVTVSYSHTETSMTMTTSHPVDLSHGIGHQYPDPVLRLVLAIWRLMQQTLADVSTTSEHPRSFRRRAERVHVPMAVTVIALRRTESVHEDAGGSINYRTTVRGHWRRVWCGPREERYQRVVYIHPHFRGPEDAPLIIRERVNALVR